MGLIFANIMDEKDMDGRLSAIEKRLESIEGKLSEKWFLPVFIVVLTALLGIATYFIQRYAINNDINENKEREIIGAFLGETKVAFYRSCKDSLIKIDEYFQSYCQLGQEPQVFEDLTSALANFKRFRDVQTIIDQDILEAIKEYSEFVAESTYEISSNGGDGQYRADYYNESKVLYQISNEKLNQGINSLKAR